MSQEDHLGNERQIVVQPCIDLQNLRVRGFKWQVQTGLGFDPTENLTAYEMNWLGEHGTGNISFSSAKAAAQLRGCSSTILRSVASPSRRALPAISKKQRGKHAFTLVDHSRCNSRMGYRKDHEGGRLRLLG